MMGESEIPMVLKSTVKHDQNVNRRVHWNKNSNTTEILMDDLYNADEESQIFKMLNYPATSSSLPW